MYEKRYDLEVTVENNNILVAKQVSVAFRIVENCKKQFMILI